MDMFQDSEIVSQFLLDDQQSAQSIFHPPTPKNTNNATLNQMNVILQQINKNFAEINKKLGNIKLGLNINNK